MPPGLSVLSYIERKVADFLDIVHNEHPCTGPESGASCLTPW